MKKIAVVCANRKHDRECEILIPEFDTLTEMSEVYGERFILWLAQHKLRALYLNYARRFLDEGETQEQIAERIREYNPSVSLARAEIRAERRRAIEEYENQQETHNA